MHRNTFAWTVAFLFSVAVLGKADFKYTVSSRVTAGPLARSIPQATEATIYVRGDYLRIDLPDGSYIIGDLNGRRETWVNAKARAYSVLDYDKFLTSPAPGGHTTPPASQSSAANAPSLSVSLTGKTQILMGQMNQEVVGKLTENPNAYCEVESWMAPSVKGFEEVSGFYSRLATALTKQSPDAGDASEPAALKADAGLWLATQAAAMRSPAWSPAMMSVISKITGSANTAKGLPMLETLRIITMMSKEQQARLRLGGQQSSPAAKSTPPTPGVASGPTSNGPSEKEAVTAAEFTFSVVSYSAQPLEESLFQVPTGYALTEVSRNDMWPAAILP
jgi:hypothetical protein